jgi:hypothetical protein
MAGHPKRVVGWRVWTDDGNCWASDRHDFSAIPRDGVLGMVVHFADGTRRVATGADYYFRAAGNSDVIMGSDQQLPTPDRYRDLVVLRGRWTDDITMCRVEASLDAARTPP